MVIEVSRILPVLQCVTRYVEVLLKEVPQFLGRDGVSGCLLPQLRPPRVLLLGPGNKVLIHLALGFGGILPLEGRDSVEERVFSVLPLAMPSATRPPANETSPASNDGQRRIWNTVVAHHGDCDNCCSQGHDAQRKKLGLRESGCGACGRVSGHAPAEPRNQGPTYYTQQADPWFGPSSADSFRIGGQATPSPIDEESAEDRESSPVETQNERCNELGNSEVQPPEVWHGARRCGCLTFTPVTNPRIALGCRPIPVVDAKNESVLSIVKNARVVFGEANKCMPASGIDAKVDRLWKRVVDLPHR